MHLQTFLSIPITQKYQILNCDTLVADERYAGIIMNIDVSCVFSLTCYCDQSSALSNRCGFALKYPLISDGHRSRYSDTSANEDNSFRNNSLAEIFVSRNLR